MKISKLRYIQIFAIVTLATSSCAGTVSNLSAFSITAKDFSVKCNHPEVVYNIPKFRFPLAAKVIRNKNCLGVAELLTVAWPGEASKKNMTAAKLLVLMYLEQYSEWSSARLITTDRINTGDKIINMAFYELKKKKQEEGS